MPSLLHKRVLITRARHQASELAAQLEAVGAICIAIPTIEIVAPASFERFDDALARLDTFDWLLFTSANAVEVFAHRLGSRGKDHNQFMTARAQAMPRIAVIGPATARAVQTAGLVVDLMPAEYTAESMSAELLPFASGARMLFFRAAEARDYLFETLTAAGAVVTLVEAYRNQMPHESITALQHLFSSEELHPDAVTFTSASTVRNLIALLDTAKLNLTPGVVLATIGPITSQALRDAGLAPTIEAASPTIPALVDALGLALNRT